MLALDLLEKGEDLKVRSKTNAKFLVISGKPINEEIARGGPFVMNTKQEILQAIEDYHSGTFVKQIMKAIQISKNGGPEVLELKDISENIKK